jgi:hypothetical protein
VARGEILTALPWRAHSQITLYAWALSLVSGVSPDRTELIGFIDANSPNFSIGASRRRKNPSNSRRVKVRSLLIIRTLRS